MLRTIPPHSYSILLDISETWTSSSTSTSASTSSSSARWRLRPSPLSPPRTTTKPTTRWWWAPGTSLRDGGQRLPGRPERGRKIRLLAKARGVNAVQVELFPKLGDLLLCIDNCEHQRETASSLAMSGRSADASMVVGEGVRGTIGRTRGTRPANVQKTGKNLP